MVKVTVSTVWVAKADEPASWGFEADLAFCLIFSLLFSPWGFFVPVRARMLASFTGEIRN